ncbi:Nucleolar protein [Trichinella spiralis]|uniref:Nucleolar protein n=1 Tax=Trichinella spiralis TaxID=6334 RepID=A0ABR3KHD0_TRISP
MNSNIRSEHVLETFGVIVFVLLVMQMPYARKKLNFRKARDLFNIYSDPPLMRSLLIKQNCECFFLNNCWQTNAAGSRGVSGAFFSLKMCCCSKQLSQWWKCSKSTDVGMFSVRCFPSNYFCMKRQRSCNLFLFNFKILSVEMNKIEFVFIGRIELHSINCKYEIR